MEKIQEERNGSRRIRVWGNRADAFWVFLVPET